MRAFEVKRGVPVIISHVFSRIINGRTQTSKKRKLYFTEDIVIDPLGKISPANPLPEADRHHAEFLAQNGYYGFRSNDFVVVAHSSVVEVL